MNLRLIITNQNKVEKNPNKAPKNHYNNNLVKKQMLKTIKTISSLFKIAKNYINNKPKNNKVK